MCVYRDLAAEMGVATPIWLREHLGNGLPEAERVAGWVQAAGRAVSSAWYESARTHARLLRWESRACW